MPNNNMMTHLLRKIKNKNTKNSKQKDIRLVKVSRVDDDRMEFLITDNVQIKEIYIIKSGKKYKLEFNQNNHSVYLNLRIPENLIFESDIKYDIYFVTDEGLLRPFLPNAQNIDSNLRHFDINPSGNISGYIYFSKSYKRAMLQLKKRALPNQSKSTSTSSNEQSLNFNGFTLNDSYIELLFDYQQEYNSDYKIVLERWGQYRELRTEWDYGKVRGFFTKSIVNNLALGFGYTVRLINKKCSDNNIIYGIVIGDNKNFQITRIENNAIHQLEWKNISDLKYYSATDGKTRLLYPDNVSVKNVYLEYKERPVFKKIEISLEDYGWIKFDVDIVKNNSMYKGIHTVYQNGSSEVFRSFNKITDLQKVYAVPNKLNVLSKIRGQKLIFSTEQAIEINDVFVTFRGDSKLHPQIIDIENKFQFSIKSNHIFEIDNIYFNYRQIDKGVEHRSVSSLNNIVVMENEE